MRTELETIREMYAYNSKVRQKYLRAIWRLPPRERYRDRGASYPSLVDIFMHVLDAYRWWFHVVYGKEKGIEEYPLGVRYTIAEARREEKETDAFVRRVVRSLQPADLAKRVTIVRKRGNETLPMRVLLLHMMEEELQHRGEMNALLWQLDIEPPVEGFDDR
ncbi:MAG TPA: DinB family protein [Thermoplasmata archaeon]